MLKHWQGGVHLVLFTIQPYAPVAQLDRALVYETKGHRFESCQARIVVLTKFPANTAFLIINSYHLISFSITYHMLCVPYLSKNELGYAFLDAGTQGELELTKRMCDLAETKESIMKLHIML